MAKIPNSHLANLARFALTWIAMLCIIVGPAKASPATDQAACFYSCLQSENPPGFDGSLPPGVSLTVIPQDSRPGGTNAIPDCDQCKPCRQKIEVLFISSDNSLFLSAYTAGPSGTPTDGVYGVYHSYASFNQILKPYCGSFEYSSVSVGGFIVTSQLNCGC